MKDKVSAANSRFVLIEPLKQEKVEAQVTGGIAVIRQKIQVVASSLIAEYKAENGEWYHAGSYVILAGDSYLKGWNKNVLNINGTDFVMCPANDIIGFIE